MRYWRAMSTAYGGTFQKAQYYATLSTCSGSHGNPANTTCMYW